MTKKKQPTTVGEIILEMIKKSLQGGIRPVYAVLNGHHIVVDYENTPKEGVEFYVKNFQSREAAYRAYIDKKVENIFAGFKGPLSDEFQRLVGKNAARSPIPEIIVNQTTTPQNVGKVRIDTSRPHDAPPSTVRGGRQ